MGSHVDFLTTARVNHPTEREDYHWLRVTADNGTSFQVELDAWPDWETDRSREGSENTW